MRYYKILVILLFMVSCSGWLGAQTLIPAGNVSGSWNAGGSPYLIEGNINVPSDSQLIISPGTELLFLGPYQLSIYGYLNASGTSNDSIYFTCPDSVESWAGVRLIDFVQILPDSVRLSYCSFSKARKNNPDSLGGAFYAKNSPRVSIDHSSFASCYGGSGGAIYLKNSSILIRNTVISNTEAERGGALYIHQSAPDLINVEISGNTGNVGGGIYFYNSNGLLQNTLISNNTSLGGGGGVILHKTSNVTMYQCIIEENTAHGSGGGIAILEGSMPIIEFCVISRNQTIQDQYVSKGGGIFVTQYGNNPLIENTEISYNLSADDGGGIYTESAISIISSLIANNESNTAQGFGGGGMHAVFNKCLVINCTFSSNMAPEGTAIYATGADLDIFNTIIWDDGITGESKIYMHNFLIDPILKIDYSDLEGGEQEINGTGTYQLLWGENNISEDPDFTDPLQGDYSLTDQSPCINTGLLDSLALLLPAKDMAMNPRLHGPTVDMGSYENQSPVFLLEQENEEQFILNAYPVPASEYINIELSKQKLRSVLTFEIISVSGQVMKSKQLVNPDRLLKIGLHNIPSGLYVLRVFDMKGQESIMFSVVK